MNQPNDRYYNEALKALLGGAGTLAPPIRSIGPHFDRFFNRINPATTFTETAAREYSVVKKILEDPNGPAAALGIKCFLQGSYDQKTAIHSINDLDIVVLTNLIFPGADRPGVSKWSRDRIFATIALALNQYGPYKGKVVYGPDSMCIKIKLGIKIELLPAVRHAGSTAPEPFCLFRPERKRWEFGYAQSHQNMLRWKNSEGQTGGTYIPMVKVLKHIRSIHGIDAVSFHIESLLHAVPDKHFVGPPHQYIPAVLGFIASISAVSWAQIGVKTPCQDRLLHHYNEWDWASWQHFHNWVSLWSLQATRASASTTHSQKIKNWQTLLGANYFPATVAT